MKGVKGYQITEKSELQSLYFNSAFSNKKGYGFYQATIKMVESGERPLLWIDSVPQGQIISFGYVQPS